ncbi:hypothetical protein K7472_08500 [Streptomyces sp. PTM05]|uniref:Uncharacterized protein n=1 Tax=Streptantibioticus parmotrematis TaxID=2873249 RepID=A0ABS7QNX9_9ACTN|nr:hypothetical protein [Streptantibioticus parmotrematis]MBY8884887.1 hypothetical protein [Streptantibioticus parmotrematis]
MAFIVNPNDDPEISRSERIARYGSMVPSLAWALLNFTLVLLSPLSKSLISRGQYVAVVLAFAVLGETVVWIGMNSLRRSAGWDCGIIGYLWSGALMTSLVAGGTLLTIGSKATYVAALIPWIPPVVATVAKRRLLRRRGVGAGVGA